MARYYALEYVCLFAKYFVEAAFSILPSLSMMLLNNTNVSEYYTRLRTEEVRGIHLLKPLADVMLRKLKYYFPYRPQDYGLKFGSPQSSFQVDFSRIPEELKNYFTCGVNLEVSSLHL